MPSRGAVTKEEFYRGKNVVREEWFVNYLDLVTWARLRVLSDGTAEVWDHGALFGFDNDDHGRFMIREGKYEEPSVSNSRGEFPEGEQPRLQADKPDQPFYFYGSW